MSQFGNTEVNGALSLTNGSSKDIANILTELKFIEDDLFKGVLDTKNILPSGSDLNNLITLGHYYFINTGSDSITNSPTSNSFLLEVLSGTGTNPVTYIEQIIYESFTGIQYSRTYFEGTWSSWRETIVKGENSPVGKMLYSGKISKGVTVNLGSDEWKKYHIFTIHVWGTNSVMVGMRFDSSVESCIRFVGGTDDGSGSLLYKANTTIPLGTNNFKNISSSEHLYMHATTTSNPYGKVIDLDYLRGII